MTAVIRDERIILQKSQEKIENDGVSIYGYSVVSDGDLMFTRQKDL